MAWNKIKFFYANSLTGLVPTSTASADYSVNYLTNMKETNYWQASSNATQTITFDSGSSYSANYLAISGHNLASSGTELKLQYSPDNAIWTTMITVNPTNDKAFVKEFGAASYRYWRIYLSGGSAPAFMAVCIWGSSTELDYASMGFDPHGFKDKARFNLSAHGYVAGVPMQYSERMVTLKFNDADATLYNKIKTWRNESGLKNFFMGWETANNPSDVYLMRPDVQFINPMTQGGLYRNITVKLRGRLEV